MQTKTPVIIVVVIVFLVQLLTVSSDSLYQDQDDSLESGEFQLRGLLLSMLDKRVARKRCGAFKWCPREYHCIARWCYYHGPNHVRRGSYEK
jgi:hypothetical protein